MEKPTISYDSPDQRASDILSRAAQEHPESQVGRIEGCIKEIEGIEKQLILHNQDPLVASYHLIEEHIGRLNERLKQLITSSIEFKNKEVHGFDRLLNKWEILVNEMMEEWTYFVKRNEEDDLKSFDKETIGKVDAEKKLKSRLNDLKYSLEHYVRSN